MKIYENLRDENDTLQKISNDLNYFDNILELKTYQIFCNSSVSQLSLAIVWDVQLFHGAVLQGKGGV